jgi:prefoldin beta subunit
MAKNNSKKNNCEDCGDECECDEDSCECGHDHSGEDQAALGVNPQMNFDANTRAAIQEIQILEHNFEQLMQQKHLFNMEISETDLALKELDTASGDVFKLVGSQVIIKTTKEKLSADLNHKKDLLNLRMKTLDSQEKEFSDRIEELRQEIMKKIGKN